MSFQKRSLTGTKTAPRPLSSSRKKLGVLLGILAAIAIGIFAVQEYHFRQLLAAPHDGPTEQKLFEIPTGSTLKQISAELLTEGFIDSRWAFEKYVKRKDAAEDFLAGRFYLAQNLTIPDVAARLLDDARREQFFTIPEGLSLAEIDARIAEKGYAAPGTFLKCIEETCSFSEFTFLPADRAAWEGYFFPETYAVHPGNFSAEELAGKMLAEFEKRAEKLGILEKDNLNEIVIMASMVEKESRDDEERPIVAGILWKRLHEGWMLGVDATVRYFTAKHTETLTESDLDADNPYNTRKHIGLPPTAITNPGESSLRAAANPKDSPYYYYLHGKDGVTHFAVTNEEHNANKAKYL